MPQLEFSQIHSYAAGTAITVPIALRSGQEIVDLLAHVDTGASHCLFQRTHAEILNLNVESGEPKTFSTATGRLETFGHMVSLEVLGIQFESMVYFFADERINKNLLGRGGWLDRIRLGIVDHDQILYLATYDSDNR